MSVERLDLPETYWELIDARARVTPDRPFLSDPHGRRLTFAGFRDTAERVAAGLHATGIEPGQTVSWQLPTTVDAVVLMAALSRLGVAQNPIIHILRSNEVGYIVDQLSSHWLITPGTFGNFDFGSMAHDIADHAAHPVSVFTATDGLPEADPASLPSVADARRAASVDGPRWIYYSSGSTGRPKGAVHSDRTLLHGSMGFISGVQVEADDVFPCAFPVTHIGGICFLVAALRVGAQFVAFATFDPAETPRQMAAAGGTILGSAVPFFQAYLAAQVAHGAEPMFPALRVCAAGGAPTPPELHYQLRDVLGRGLLNGWGLTEFPVATFSRADDPDEWRAHTVGPPVPGVSVRVIAADGTDHTTDGGIGELRLDGPQKLHGYVDPDLDAEAFDELGYFRTGDLGFVDQNGNVQITGRLKDIIIRKAENISAIEVENALFSHPAVADVAVIGVPDPTSGERVCAVVVLADGHTELTLASLGEHCRALGLANQKIPEQLEFMASLPRNPAGKVVKHEIRATLFGE